ncbi:MAG: PhzF family phenazine biosynthesis protein [Alphaproteobacteria bacterium]|nr:PhzF family phenazine biosynthesis protein [Alphaproteobacteria bacterium]
MGTPPLESYRAGGNFLLVYAAQADVAGLAPDFRALKQIGVAQDDAGFIATAPGGESDIDFVSRYFAPSHGIDEDPVTGSTHCTLTPYWSQRLGKPALTARQISARGGMLHLIDRGGRIGIAGRAVDYLQGVITV